MGNNQCKSFHGATTLKEIIYFGQQYVAKNCFVAEICEIVADFMQGFVAGLLQRLAARIVADLLYKSRRLLTEICRKDLPQGFVAGLLPKFVVDVLQK